MEESLATSSRGDTDKSTPLLETESQLVARLPDLTERIIALGVYDEYYRFHQGYQNWRQNKPRGARGEATHTGLKVEAEKDQHISWQFWKPTAHEWSWRRTTSFWIIVSFTEGSMIFSVTSFLYNVPSVDLGVLWEAVVPLSTYYAVTLFGIGCYLMNYSIMNIAPRKLGSPKTRQLNPFRVRQHLEYARSVGMSSWPYAAALCYFIGAMLYQLGMTVAFVPNLPPLVTELVIYMPYIIGGVFFVVGTVFEGIECDVFCHPSMQLETFGVAVSLVGGCLYFVGGPLYLIGGQDVDWWANICWGVGSLFYLAGSTISTFMWRNEQFGLLYSWQLSVLGVARRNSDEEDDDAGHGSDMPDRFTVASVLVIMLCCLTAALAVVVFLCKAVVPIDTLLNTKHPVRYVVHTFYPLCIAVATHFLLAARAAVPRPPEKKPWRNLYWTAHAFVMIAGILLALELGAMIAKAPKKF